VPQYFVENSHPAIVTADVFEAVQEEVRRRSAIGKRLSGSRRFVCRIICGDCGGFYGSKVWDSNNEHRRTVWQCNHKYQNDDTCRTPHLTEEEIKSAFVSAFNRLLSDKARYIAEYKAYIAKTANTSAFDEQTARLEMACSETALEAQNYVSQNAKTAQDQEKYRQEFDALLARHNAAKSQLDEVKREKLKQCAHREKTRRFLALLEQTTEPLTAFDERLWQAAADSMVVRQTGDIAVIFHSGAEIRLDSDAYSG